MKRIFKSRAGQPLLAAMFCAMASSCGGDDGVAAAAPPIATELAAACPTGSGLCTSGHRALSPSEPEVYVPGWALASASRYVLAAGLGGERLWRWRPVRRQ